MCLGVGVGVGVRHGVWWGPEVSQLVGYTRKYRQLRFQFPFQIWYPYLFVNKTPLLLC